jgi:hypothetical protein
MSAGDGDAVTPGHHLAQQRGALDHRDARPLRGLYLWIALWDRRGDDHQLGAIDLFRGMADKSLDAQGAQLAQDGRIADRPLPPMPTIWIR